MFQQLYPSRNPSSTHKASDIDLDTEIDIRLGSLLFRAKLQVHCCMYTSLETQTACARLRVGSAQISN